jgi:hypothetical protein
MQSYQSNIEIINIDGDTNCFKDKENTYELTFVKTEMSINLILKIEVDNIHTYKATLTQTDLSKCSLFKAVESLDNALSIMKDCLKNKGVSLKYEKGYAMTFFILFYGTYITASILLDEGESNIEFTVS